MTVPDFSGVLFIYSASLLLYSASLFLTLILYTTNPMIPPMSRRPATPPTAPPTIAPVFDPCFGSGVGELTSPPNCSLTVGLERPFKEAVVEVEETDFGSGVGELTSPPNCSLSVGLERPFEEEVMDVEETVVGLFSGVGIGVVDEVIISEEYSAEAVKKSELGPQRRVVNVFPPSYKTAVTQSA